MSLREQFIDFFKNKSEITFGKEAFKEASAIVGTGTGAGGRLDIKGASVALRQPNPFRWHCTQLTTSGSTTGYVMKTGNAGVNYRDFFPNIGNPNIGTAYWTLPVQIISTAIPVRTAVLNDVTDLEAAGLFYDLMQELEQSAAQSMVSNNDQGLVAGTGVTVTASTTVNQNANGNFQWNLTVAPATFTVGQGARVAGITPAALNGDYLVIAKDATSITILYPTFPGQYISGTATVAPITNWAQGGASGLRGLNQYIDTSPGNAAYGTSGTGSTNGIHSIVTINQIGASIAYNDVTATASALPAVYWEQGQVVWMAHPTTIQNLRQIKDSQGLPVFLEVGDNDGAAIGYMFGFPVHPNSYIDAPNVAGRYVLYLADWQRALTIYDHVESIKLVGYEQVQPGFIQIYGELRLSSSVVDPFAIVRLKSV